MRIGLRHIIFLVAAFLSLASCTEVLESGRLVVTFQGEGAATKGMVAGVDDEAVYTLDVLAFFTQGGRLDNHRRGNGSSVSLEVTPGVSLNYYIIANAPKELFDGVLDESSLLSLLCNLSDNSNRIMMVGQGSGTFTKTGSVQVSLSRLVDKVSLSKVTPTFLASSYVGSVVKLSRVYLINVNGSCPLTGVPAYGSATPWYNKTEFDISTPSVVRPLLCQDLDITLTGSASVNLGCSFLCCPNPVTEDVTSLTAPSWSPRKTRLVVELTVDGTPMYYPITLDANQCNNHYVINEVILKGPGSNDPDIPVERDNSISFEVTVSSWVAEQQVIDY